MADFKSKYSGQQIDEAVSRSFDLDMGLNGWIKLKSTKADPYHLDYLVSVGNYTVFHIEGGTAEMHSVSPLKISVVYLNDVLTQIVTIMDFFQSRQQIDGIWTAWETWYSTGFIYQQATEPPSPMKNSLWIDTSDVEQPVFHVYDGAKWREVRPTDAMDKSVYDSTGKNTDVFAYIDKAIHEMNTMPDGENTYADAYAMHIANTTIHLTAAEKRDLMTRPSNDELETRVSTITNEVKAEIQNVSNNTLSQLDKVVGVIEGESTNILNHMNDESVHVNAMQVASWDAKADKNHEHNLDGKVAVDASALVSGVIPLARIPHIVQEIVVKVANDDARFALTLADVQNGDSVYVIEGRKFYYVVDDSKLDSEEGYLYYSTTLSAVVSWDQIAYKPNTRNGYGITDVYTMNETDMLIYGSDAESTDYIVNVFSRSKHMYSDRWYYSLEPAVEYASFSDARVIDDKGNIYFTGRLDSGAVHLLMFNPIKQTETYHNINKNEKAVESVAVTYIAQLSSGEGDEEYITIANAKATLLKFYKSMMRVTSDTIEEGDVVTVDLDYPYIYSALNDTLYSVDSETGVIAEVNVAEIGVVVYDNDATSALYSVNPDDPSNVVTYLTSIESDVKFDGVYTGMETEDGEYTGAFVLHGRNSLYFYPAKADYMDKMRQINFTEDTIIADTIEFQGGVAALVLIADDVQSSINESWKAYQYHMYLAEINTHTMTYTLRDISVLSAVNEVGSSITEDYTNMLNSEYASIYAEYPAHKSYRIIESNGALITFSVEAPFVSLNMRHWTQIRTQWIDTDKGVVSQVEINGTDVRFSHNYNNDCIIITKVVDGKRYWAYSVDNYNYYTFTPGYNWDSYLEGAADASHKNALTVSAVANTNGIYIIAAPYSDTAYLECLQLKLSTSSNAINEALSTVNDVIENETGIPTSKTDFYEFSKLMRAPVDVTNGEAGYYALFVDTAEPNPTKWYHIHYVNGDVEDIIPEVVNMPSDVSTWYIKGGYIASGVNYIIFHLVHTDGTVSVDVGALDVGRITLVNPSELTLSYLNADNIANIQYRIHMDNTTVYLYPNFVHEYEDILINNIPVLEIDGLIAITTLHMIAVPGDFHTNTARPNIQWIDCVGDYVCMYRMRRGYSKTVSPEYTPYELTIWDKHDYLLTTPVFVNVLDCAAYSDYTVAYPFELFEYNNKLYHFLTYDNMGQLLEYSPVTNTTRMIYMDGLDFNGETSLPPYAGIFDSSTASLMVCMVGSNTAVIQIYRLTDSDVMEHDDIVYVGEVTSDTLSMLAYGNNWVFDGILPLYVNHTFMLMNTSPCLDVEDRRASIFTGTPIITFVRDNGIEMYKKSFSLAAQYTKKIADYKTKFVALSYKIARANEYADEILRILG